MPLENGDFVTQGDLQQFSELVQMESVNLFLSMSHRHKVVRY